jgi:sodium/proline symporter
MNAQILTAFGLYLVVLVTIGLLSHKKQTTSDEFIVGNRSLNYWLTALSAHASDMSNWLFMGYPAAILLGGLSNAWIAIGLAAGMFANWQLIAARLRSDTERYQSNTLSTYFERRLSDTSGSVRLLTALIILFFLTWYLAAGLIGIGLLFESVFGINYYLGITLALVVAVSYTFYGGYTTVAWADLFQALFLLFFIVLVPVIAFFQLPSGVDSIFVAAEESGINLSFIPDFSLQTFLSGFFLFTWGLGYWGQPHILTKFMGINSVDQMNRAKYVGMSWQILTLLASTAVGLVGIGFFYHGGLSNPELVFIEMVTALFHPFLAGIVLCAILAATMSTMDSQILVCASVLSEDLYSRIIHQGATEREKVIVSRLGVIVIAAIALFLAFQRSNTVLDSVQYAWTGLGSAFGPLLLMCLYSKKITRNAGVAGIIAGGSIAAIWHWINPCLTEVCIPSMVPGFFSSLAAILIVMKLKK